MLVLNYFIVLFIISYFVRLFAFSNKFYLTFYKLYNFPIYLSLQLDKKHPLNFNNSDITSL